MVFKIFLDCMAGSKVMDSGARTRRPRCPLTRTCPTETVGAVWTQTSRASGTMLTGQPPLAKALVERPKGEVGGLGQG